MRVCIVAEGCYPYVVGGVSGWIHSIIQNFPNLEFVILTVLPNRSMRGKFAYRLPDNITEVHEVYLDDLDWGPFQKRGRRQRLTAKEFEAIRAMVLNENVDWDILFDLFHRKNLSIDALLMGEDFLKITTELYFRSYPEITFSDFLWTMRSIYLPLFFVLKMDIPKADIYHCSATGYAGVLGSMGKYFHKGMLLVSEHGIYTREREEELIKARWVQGIYKNIWIEQFMKMSQLAYARADLVTSLYERARQLQMELGCPAEKTMVTPNGIDIHRLKNIPGKGEQDKGMIHVGAIIRITPIKDVKTMIQAFAFAHAQMPNLHLWLMGPNDEDPEYAQECYEQVDMLGIEDITFTGQIDIREYLGRMDMTILTSISEGQPLAILESFAAHKPVIATDVGNCRELIYGDGDGIGPAGILTHIMNLQEITDAILKLAKDRQLREQMGENGYMRVNGRFKIEDMKKTYRDIYESFAARKGISWSEKPFTLENGDGSNGRNRDQIKSNI